MGGKIKSIILLITLLAMIYYQNSPAFQAEATANARSYFSEAGSVFASENIGETNGTGEEEAGAEDGGDSGGIDDKESGDSEEEDEGSSGDSKEEGDEGENGDNQEEGDGGEEGDEGDDGDEEEKPEPEPIQKYELQIREPDGKNGYHVTAPEIRLCHVSKRGCTVYRLESGGAVRAEGKLENEGDAAVLSGGELMEGENILTVYMEDETGTRLDEYSRSERILLDTKAPSLDVTAPCGFDAWYQQEARISAQTYDGESGSGVESLSVYCGEELIGTVSQAYGEFLISNVSKGNQGAGITVIVSDRAGHTASAKRTLYIDGCAPGATISGAEDYMITGQPVHAVLAVADDNTLRDWDAEVEWEDTDGEKHRLAAEEWTGDSGRKETSFDFTEDGIYRMKLSATDMAGYTCARESQVIIDGKNPVIRYVDRLDGKYVKKFCWSYPKEEFVEDFTTYQYEMKLDEELYSAGEEVTQEGRHVLKVTAEDSAGNRSEAKAQFTVDHTPPKILFQDIEEEGVYEEEKTFQAALEDAGDEIQEVRVNGIVQPLDKAESEYSYTAKEHQAYEVSVRAVDKAGNVAAAFLSFQVVPKETLLQKVIKPIKNIFQGEEKDRAQKQGQEMSDSESGGGALPVIPAAVLCGLGGTGVLAAICRKYYLLR